MISPTLALADDDEVDIDRATWSEDRDRLTVRGDSVPDNATVTIWYGEKEDDGAKIGETQADGDGEWRFRITGIDPVPCDVTAKADGEDDDKEVRNRPNNCSNDGDGGNQPPPVAACSISVSPTSLAFGNVNVGSTASSSTTVSNNGTADCNVSLSGITGSDFSASPTSFSVAPSASRTVNVTYTPGQVGADSDTLLVNSNDPDTPTANVALSGNGVQQQVQECNIAVNPTSLAFGNVNVGSTASRSTTVSNNGTVDCNVSLSGISGSDFSASPASFSVAPSASRTVNVTYTPGQVGTDSETLLVNSNDPDTSTTNVALSGNGVQEQAECTSRAEHCSITEYTGPEVCVDCHEQESVDMHGSVHYQQNGPTDYVTNIDGPGGERGFDFAATGINTYCGSHENSPRFTCAGCHVGNGRFPKTPGEMNFPLGDFQFEALTQGQQDELSNIDCLTCHQEQYRRFPNWTDANGNSDIAEMFESLTLENVCLDASGNLADPLTSNCVEGPPVIRTGLAGVPVVDPITEDFDFVPAGAPGSLLYELPAESPFAPMSITTEVAAQTVHTTTRRSCLSCHAGAAGADGAKRGDLTSLHANPDIGLDYHMSADGQNFNCSRCHSEVGDNGESHRVRGRGLDLRPNDVAERFTCENSGCHSDRPHADFDFNSPTQDTHAVKVACQTCHVPTYGKGKPTETSRDWQDPHLSQSACNGRGGWLPREDKGANLIPSYAWYDGTSEVYYMGESLDGVPTVRLAADVAQRFVGNFSSTDDAVVLGAPSAIIDGNNAIDMTLGVNNPGAKLQAMKEHWGKLARNDRTNTMIAHSTYDFFRTGDFDQAVLSGLVQASDMNENDPFTVVPVHTFQTLNHGVETRGSALSCNNCHRSLSANSRIDLENDYGYGPRTGTPAVINPRSEVAGRDLNGDLDLICAQCHGNETNNSDRSFTEVHNRHVSSRSRDCAACHNFSRLDVRPGLNLNN